MIPKEILTAHKAVKVMSPAQFQTWLMQYQKNIVEDTLQQVIDLEVKQCQSK